MATIHQKIVTSFLAKLSQAGEIEAETIDQLRVLLADSRKLKAEDLVKVFAQPAGGDLK
jgi:hypothetical protein